MRVKMKITKVEAYNIELTREELSSLYVVISTMTLNKNTDKKNERFISELRDNVTTLLTHDTEMIR